MPTEDKAAPKLLTVIADRDKLDGLEELLSEKRVSLRFIFQGEGTASSEILQSLGLDSTEKILCTCVTPGTGARSLMNSLSDKLSLSRPGNGIAFIMPISGVSSSVAKRLADETREGKEVVRMEQTGKGYAYSLVISVINQGYSEVLMDSAREVGAHGGTIINARRSKDVSKFFGVTLQEEKEVVAILVKNDDKRGLMEAITKSCGPVSEADGIVFSLPVEACAGLGEPV